MRQIGDAGVRGPGRLIRQGEIAPQNRVARLGPKLGVLRQVGLHQPQFRAVDETGRALRKPLRPIGGERQQQHRGEYDRWRAVAAAARVDQRRRRREYQNRREVETVKPNQRARLRENRRARERHAEIVPGETGQNMTAQPFGAAEADGQSANAGGARRP